MGWLDRVLHWIFREQMTGLRFDDPDPLTLHVPREPGRFLRALPLLGGPDAIACFEGSTEGLVPCWLERHEVASEVKLAAATLMPRSDFYHVALGGEGGLSEFATLVETHGIAVPSIHVYVHEGGRVILAWYDAFLDHPVFIARAVPPARVHAFAAAAGGDLRTHA
jgi:hypothetical protein